MSSYQIRPRNPAHSIVIQLSLFASGYHWAYGVPNIVQYTDAKYLIFCHDTSRIKWSDVEDPDSQFVSLRSGTFIVTKREEIIDFNV